MPSENPDFFHTTMPRIANALETIAVALQGLAEGYAEGRTPKATQTVLPDRWTLTDIEVAERLGVSRFTVRQWRLKGVGPAFKKFGRAVRYRPVDVDEYERHVTIGGNTNA